MSFVAGAVVVGFALFLMYLTVLVFVRPAIAEGFFTAFASSRRAHFIEQSIRLLFGVALFVRSSLMWQPQVFWLLGWVIVITAVGLMILPWRVHHRYGQWAIPLVVRFLWFYGLGLFAFAVLLLYGVFAPVFS